TVDLARRDNGPAWRRLILFEELCDCPPLDSLTGPISVVGHQVADDDVRHPPFQLVGEGLENFVVRGQPVALFREREDNGFRVRFGHGVTPCPARGRAPSNRGRAGRLSADGRGWPGRRSPPPPARPIGSRGGQGRGGRTAVAYRCMPPWRGTS